MSKTTNTYQLGIKGANQWVGEDVVIMAPDEPFYFSAIAIGKVHAFEIEKRDIQSKLPI